MNKDTQMITAVASSIFFLLGISVGGLAAFDIAERKYVGKRKRKGDPGLYVNHGRTNMALIAVGIHALKDNLYDSYELRDILKEVKV